MTNVRKLLEKTGIPKNFDEVDRAAAIAAAELSGASSSMTWVSNTDDPTAESPAKIDAFNVAVAAAMHEAIIDPWLGGLSDGLLDLHDHLDDMAGWPFAFAGALSALILRLMAQAVRAGKPAEAAAAEAQGRCRFVARAVDRRIDLAIAIPASATRLSGMVSDVKIDGLKPDAIDDTMATMMPKRRETLEQHVRDLLALEARLPEHWSYNFASRASTIALHIMSSYLDQGMDVDDAHVRARAAASILGAKIAKAQEVDEEAIIRSCESRASEEAIRETIRRIEGLLAREADEDELIQICRATYARLWPTLPRRPQDVSGHAIAISRQLSRKNYGHCRAVAFMYSRLLMMRLGHDGYGETKACAAANKWSNTVIRQLRRQKLGRQ
jgi:hypothetical protein